MIVDKLFKIKFANFQSHPIKIVEDMQKVRTTLTLKSKFF